MQGTVWVGKFGNLGIFLSLLIIGVMEFGIFRIYYHMDTGEVEFVSDAYLYGCLYFFYNLLIYPIARKAFFNIIKKESGWAKTVRNSETSVIVTRYD
ncbi:MAG: hypothetical protein LBP35_04590 [Candidatus Ancillula trichonymphae]|nr:hypothetical protein [Candidatus Ancillula trichonymphae]